MRALQPSFARGEISPLLHARADLALYAVAAAKLVNFIVLPQGGAARRPGFVRLGDVLTASGSGDACPVRLIPFVYNSDDTMIIELGDMVARIWKPSGGTPVTTIASPYASEDAYDVKYVQSGNFVYMTHRDYPVKILRRRALDDWAFENFEFKNGPWLAGPGGEDIKLTAVPYQPDNPLTLPFMVWASDDYFDAAMLGALIQLSHTVSGNKTGGESELEPDWSESGPIEIRGTWYLRTFNKWRGEVVLQKSVDGGESWHDVLTLERLDTSEQGNFERSGAEGEENMLYRVRAQHLTGSGKIAFTLESNGYTKSNIFKIGGYYSPKGVFVSWEKDKFEASRWPVLGKETADWRLGAWSVNPNAPDPSKAPGYPSCAAIYQERLVFAGSAAEPQTVWMSKVADMGNFGVSDPMRDDDAITITLSADDCGGIRSLLAMSDVLAFTASGEWKITGAGENGAISANAVVAHQQSNIGTSGIQPLVVHGQAVIIQAHRTQAQCLQYLFEFDGYRGSDLSVMSSHLFGWKTERGEPPIDKRIRYMAYQQAPDSIIWFALEDGTAATCTYQPEHEMAGWARQVTDGRIGSIACVPHGRGSELWAAVRRGGQWGIERLAPREEESLFTDNGLPYESLLETLRVNLDSQGGSMMASKKFIPRVTAYAVRSESMRAGPKADRIDRKGDRARVIRWEYSPEMSEADIQLDSGFGKNAGIRIWTESGPLTILALSPVIAVNGGQS
jgi:hypothetical protein